MVEVKDLGQYEGAEVTIGGWVDQIRVHGKVAFVVVRDGTGYVQGVLVKKELPEEVWEVGTNLTQESSLEITGTVRADARSPGGFEMGLTDLKLLVPLLNTPSSPRSTGWSSSLTTDTSDSGPRNSGPDSRFVRKLSRVLWTSSTSGGSSASTHRF